MLVLSIFRCCLSGVPVRLGCLPENLSNITTTGVSFAIMRYTIEQYT